VRLLACGDLHLTERSWLGEEWLREQERAWRRVVEIACELDVDALLFAGDAFEHRRPTPTELAAFQRPLNMLRQNVIPGLAIVGNHDREDAERVAALEVAAWGSPLTVYREPALWGLPDGDIACLPWTPIARLIAQTGRDEQVYERAAECLITIARDLRAQSDNDAILLAHWSVSGARLPNGLPVEQLREPIIPQQELIEMGWQAVVLGHIHQGGHFGPHVLYVGSLVPLTFGEDGPHGCWLLDTDDPDWQESGAAFIGVDGPRLVTIDIDPLDPRIGEEVAGAYVRLRYEVAEEDLGRVDPRELRQLAERAGARRVRLEPTVLRRRRPRAAPELVEMGAVEAVRAWCQAQGLAPGQIDRCIERSRRYLAEEVQA
jgi:DNA repair exonuclease SbcCD nuclease subunit